MVLDFVEFIKKKHPQLTFKLLIVISDQQQITTKHNNIDVAKVGYFAPYHKAMKAGDDEAWDKILSNYLTKPQKTFNYFNDKKRITVEIWL